MTTVGENRRSYSAQVDPAPSRFTPEYSAWCLQADAWAAEQGLTRAPQKTHPQKAQKRNVERLVQVGADTWVSSAYLF